MTSSHCAYPEISSIRYAPWPIRTGRSAHLAADVACLDREALFAQFSPLVKRLIRQYATTPDMSQDLFGELYLIFDDLLNRYDPSRGIPVNAYLVRQLTVSAYTLCRKQWRQTDHETPLLEEAMDHNQPDPTVQWDTTLLHKQVTARLPSVIDSLPLRQRQVLICRYYDERSFEEIAQMLQIRPSSARSLLRHALNRLREQMVGDRDLELAV